MPGNGLAETSGRTAQELLEEFEQTGNQAPFEEIVRRYGGMVYSVCYQVTRNAHDAEDAAQATFLTLAIQHKASRSVKYVGPWLQHVAYRTSLDLRRSHKRRVAREERHSEMAIQSGRFDPVTPPVDGEEVRSILRDELNKLPAKYRLPLILHYFGGLTPGEISKELGCRPKTLGVRLFRGRKMLAQNLADRGIAISAGFLALALIDAIQHTVAEGFICKTSYAAAHVAAGQHFSAGLVSGQVLGLTRIAGRAVVLSKLKITFAIVMTCATAMSGAAEMVRRYAPSNWHLQLDIPRLLEQGIRALLNGLQRPIQEFAQTPTIDLSGPPATAKFDDDARFVHSGNYTLPVDLANPNGAPHLPAFSSVAAARAAPSVTAQPAGGLPRGASAGLATSSIARSNNAETAAPPQATEISTASAVAPPRAIHPDRIAVRGGSGGSGAGREIAYVGGLSEVPYSSGLVTTGPEPFAGDGVHQSVRWYGPQPFGSFTSPSPRPPIGPQPPNGTPSNPSHGGVVVPDVLATASVAVTPGTNTYGFDQVNTSGTPVNSPEPHQLLDALVQMDDVQVTMRQVTDPGHAQIEQLSVTSSLVPSLPDPAAQNVISVWSFDTTATASGGVDLVVHYDDLVPQLRQTNAEFVRLWAYDDGGWHRLSDSTLMTDMGTNLLWGHAGDLQFFAVSAPVPAAAPEPAGAVLLSLGAAIVGLTRRRRRA